MAEPSYWRLACFPSCCPVPLPPAVTEIEPNSAYIQHRISYTLGTDPMQRISTPSRSSSWLCDWWERRCALLQRHWPSGYPASSGLRMPEPHFVELMLRVNTAATLSLAHVACLLLTTYLYFGCSLGAFVVGIYVASTSTTPCTRPGRFACASTGGIIALFVYFAVGFVLIVLRERAQSVMDRLRSWKVAAVLHSLNTSGTNRAVEVLLLHHPLRGSSSRGLLQTLGIELLFLSPALASAA